MLCMIYPALHNLRNWMRVGGINESDRLIFSLVDLLWQDKNVSLEELAWRFMKPMQQGEIQSAAVITLLKEIFKSLNNIYQQKKAKKKSMSSWKNFNIKMCYISTKILFFKTKYK